jgi:prevent-host-death family protein
MRARQDLAVRFAPQARRDLDSLDPQLRSRLERTIHTQLARHPTIRNRLYIRQLHDRAGPRFCLRVGSARVFYDVEWGVQGRAKAVWVLAVVSLTTGGLGSSAEPGVLRVPLAQARQDLCRYLKSAQQQNGPIVITRHGKAAGVLIGFASEDDWIEYRLRNDPAFLELIDVARCALGDA